MRLAHRIAWLCALLLAPASAASGQSRGSAWELDFFAGVIRSQGPREITIAVPPPGDPITTSGPITPSRAVSSWFFGDGAAILNSVNEAFGVPRRLAPLDAAIALFDANGRTGGRFGVRVRRILTRRFALEGSVDVLGRQSSFADDLDAATELTRASFEAAWNDLLLTGPTTNIVVGAERETTGGGRRDVAITAALEWAFPGESAFVPYVVAGGGVITGMGAPASVELTGRYAFTVAVPNQPTLAIDESDRVTLSIAPATTPVAVAGGGVRRSISPRWGLRVDARLLLGRNATRVLLDASPSSDSLGPSGFIEVANNPSIQFSSDPATGRRSTLSGPDLEGFEAIRGSGLQMRFLITAGVTLRF
jgi:hypothetical protein